MQWRHWGEFSLLSDACLPFTLAAAFHVTDIGMLFFHNELFHSTCIHARIGCTTARIIKNIKDKINDVDDIDGFEDLREEDQEKVKTAFEEGHGKQNGPN